MIKGKKLTIKGLVQGVGYRQHCAQAARSLGIKGYVKNLMSGDVEAVVYGDEADIKEFIRQITARDFAFEVNEVISEDLDDNAGELYAGFIIRY